MTELSMNRLLLACLGAALLSPSVSATSVNCRPGKLSAQVSAPESVTELRLTGSANAADFFFIDREMTALQTLDLSECEITGYSGDRLGGRSSYPADRIPDGVFAGSPITSILLPSSGAVSIGDFAFAGSAIISLTIPANISGIGRGAFAGCPDLTTASLGSATSGGYAFNNCPSLRSVNLGSVTALADADFAGCGELSSVTGSAALISIGSSVFQDCGSLKEFDFGTKLLTIGNSAFSGTNLRAANFVYAAPLDSIGEWAFANNPSLVTVTVPQNTRHIGRGAFFGCPALTAIEIPEGCPALADYTLTGATALDSLTLDYGVTEIGQFALKGASAVKYITLPGSITYLGDHAMDGMTSLTAIDATTMTQVPALGEDVFEGIAQKDVRLDVWSLVAPDFEAAPQWQDFHINATSSGVDAPASPGAEAVSVRGYIDGASLHIEAQGSEITTAELYDPAGTLLAAAQIQNTCGSVSIEEFSAYIYLVRCTLANGNVATLKLAR